MGCLAFSKDVKTWVDRRNTLHWLKRYHSARISGRKHKIKFCGLKRACKSCKLPHPSQTSLESILGQLKMCVAAMKKLSKKAPRLCKDMLIRRLEKHVWEKNTVTKYPGKCPPKWRIWGHFSGFEGVDVTRGTRSRISGHISARARACMLRNRSAFFGTLFGLLFANFGLLHQFFWAMYTFRNAFGARQSNSETHLGLLSICQIQPILYIFRNKFQFNKIY